MDQETLSELTEVVSQYDVGELVWFERDERGYCNVSFAIETDEQGNRKRYFLRRYWRGITVPEVTFEHSVIRHLSAQGFDLSARLHETRDGRTYVERRERGTDAIFYALFDFLPGEDRYTWVDPRCTAAEIESAACVLARFHEVMYGFEPEGRRAAPSIVDLLPVVAEHVKQGVRRAGKTVFDDCLRENGEAILAHIAAVQQALAAPVCAKLVRLVVHGDYHPGNLKFTGDRVVGLFDFDWSRIDLRCFDVALAIFYFFVGWRGRADGVLDWARMRRFVRTYQDFLAGSPLGPLDENELACLPHLISAANLYVLNWTVSDFGPEVDPEEYLVYLEHSVRFVRWLNEQANWASLERACEAHKRANAFQTV